MLRSTQELENFTIDATDGEIGHVKDFYFEDNSWIVRYLVVDAGSWLTSRKVLISPISVRQPSWADHSLPVGITREQVKNSPDIDTDMPVSRQNETRYLGYYGYPSYWGGAGMWGDSMYPYAMVPGYAGTRLDWAEHEREERDWLAAERARHSHDDPHLRSCQAVTGYHLHATDGDIGHVAGFLMDDETWAIRYLIVDTSNWWLGHKVLIAPPWITEVNWKKETVSVDLSRESVKSAPAYDPGQPWLRPAELGLYHHHGRSGYWAGMSAAVSGI